MAKNKKVDDREIQSLSTIEHILLRPNMYIGGVKPSETIEWTLNEEGGIYVDCDTWPLKPFDDEILSNEIISSFFKSPSI